MTRAGLWTLVVIGLVLVGLTGCGGEAPASAVEVYLLAGDVPPSELAALGDPEPAEKPLLSRAEIVSYREDTHEIELTAGGFEAVRDLEVPVSGRSFAVCIDRRPVYVGAFWAAYSSLSFDGVIIETTLTTEEHPVIRIELGYPGPDFFRGPDPRSDPDMLQALERAGKLRRQ